MKKRAFFQSLARAAAIIALAPQLAFRATPKPFCIESSPEFNPAMYHGKLTWVNVDDNSLSCSPVVKREHPFATPFKDAVLKIYQ